MHSSLTAVVLCIFAQACVAGVVSVSQAGSLQQVTQTVNTAPLKATKAKAVTPAEPTGAMRAGGGELIKTAAAGTRETPPPVQRQAVASVPSDEEEPARSGPAMLFSALALMSAIALRRYGSNKQ